jgi:adenylate cyclase
MSSSGKRIGIVPVPSFTVAARLLDLRSGHQRILERFASRGTIAILFTDIADFTAATDAGGDRAAVALLDAHDAIVTPAVRGHRGRLIKSMGDGAMAAFHDPAEAVKAAAEILASARTHPGVRGHPLKLRVGIDAGRPPRRGDDYIGHTVNVAARLTRAARPGEALVSDAVRKATPDNGLAVRWRERGRPTLKGVTKPPHTWRLLPSSRAG